MASDLRLKEQLPELTSRIVQTYTEVSAISHLGHCACQTTKSLSKRPKISRRSFTPATGDARGCTLAT